MTLLKLNPYTGTDLIAFAVVTALILFIMSTGKNGGSKVIAFFKKRKEIEREKGLTYMIRYNLFECPLFSIKVHKFLLSDHACMHDHPWAFITFILKGGYVEHTPKGSKIYGPFSLLFRKATYVHRLEIHQPAWTLVVTFRKVRDWGFFTPTGWVKWFKYHNTNQCE